MGPIPVDETTGLAAGVVSLSSVAVRPIYVRLGILPEMASGLEHAAEVSVPPEQS